MNPVVFFCVIFLIGGSGLAAAFSWETFRSERERFHPKEWAKAGSPPFSGYRSFSQRRQLARYLMRGTYRQVGDARLTRLGENARAAIYVSRIVVVGFILTMFGR